MGYQFSVWYIPINYTEIQKLYNISHIPHITLDTNLTFDNAVSVFLDSRYEQHKTFIVTSDLVMFPSLYEHNPLSAYGVWMRESDGCISTKKPHWKPHMSFKYFNCNTKESTDNLESISIGKNIKCYKTLVNTVSNIPDDWYIIC
jgi:hypothetical protein